MSHSDDRHWYDSAQVRQNFEDARRKLEDLRLLVCIPFLFRASRVQLLFQVIRSISQLRVRSLEIRVLTDMVEEESLQPIRSLFAPMVADGQLKLHPVRPLSEPTHLPWAHKEILRKEFAPRCGESDIFMYIEDDILFGDLNLTYWVAARRFLRPFKLIPSFVRYEYNCDDNSVYATDHVYSADVTKKELLDFGGWSFVRTDFPFDGIYLLDRELMERHLTSPAFDRDSSRALAGWGNLERAAMGPRFDDWPSGCGSRSAFPLRKADLVPAFPCWIHHIPNSYARVSGLHAKLRMDKLFFRG